MEGGGGQVVVGFCLEMISGGCKEPPTSQPEDLLASQRAGGCLEGPSPSSEKHNPQCLPDAAHPDCVCVYVCLSERER